MTTVTNVPRLAHGEPVATQTNARMRAPAVTILVLGGVLATSGLLPWFSSKVATTVTSNGFEGNIWLFHVPIGWFLAGVGGLLIGLILPIVAPSRARWRTLPPLATVTIGVLTAVYVMIDRFHAHSYVDSGFRRSIETLIRQHPELEQSARATLASANLGDGYGMAIAIVSALGVVAAGIWLVRRSSAEQG